MPKDDLPPVLSAKSEEIFLKLIRAAATPADKMFLCALRYRVERLGLLDSWALVNKPLRNGVPGVMKVGTGRRCCGAKGSEALESMNACPAGQRRTTIAWLQGHGHDGAE